ncbi:putative deoxyuridine 5'-triphosphate nucleotidohydrolase [Fulvia fulva]|uniref:Deoxyuridine 5'-triphosphate nucleotidohydrolase n=1 Tax=Passalora fulva TaxID=5499 RepID=A0A9Q8UVZ9_PASFU|nr:putative deoxyuridine 5'-triphosphate nucleotidohydrolase [Fulvia fulva]KAK4610394.1 putative deoxyuridine 5'-triphosphate nucleotidohydrolase [Fulvia fulva]KAK4611080.1 putative deoxyuridine 5'-triphosphate nucleotidohydrolase [Fulvia fulva]UJO24460.1 putative deoxyuridine 5'-triphosphate nucleotidohydrolase [Fulvia fulva]WPV21810.1 putative deoxyuridine 5'-triphosphate nucleotidohydrolase [Fulvia fulva]WPV36858.1 putative deoxyuridine 5'-triphosphate nucleotidohydrolase [Fulvia fulva]
MIIPGKTAVARGIIRGLRDRTVQSQPCGVDLSLRHVLRWTSPATIDLSNTFRAASATERIPFADDLNKVHLSSGSYLVEFNEQVDIPLDIMGQVCVRSSLWRSGVLLRAGVMDSGYRGAVGAMLQVASPHGITLYGNARLAQMVFHQMSESVDGYDGAYQNASKL